MQPEQQQPQPNQNPNPGMPPAPQPGFTPNPNIPPTGPPTYSTMPPTDSSLPPKKGKLPLMIVILLLVVALAAAAWWWMNAITPTTTTNISLDTSNQASQTKFEPNVTWVAPPLITATSNGIDNSDADAQTFSYPDPNDCSVNTNITTFGVSTTNGATVKDVALNFEGAQLSGATITKNEVGPSYTFKDTAGKEYQFESMKLEETIQGENQVVIVAYRAFDTYAVMIDYVCSAETWDSQNGDLALLVAEFKLKTQ